MPRPRVKVCCIMDADEARLAVSAGADALGLVSRMPSGPGVISESAIAAITRCVPPGVATFLLTCETNASRIIEQQRRTRVNTIQLCDAVDTDALDSLRSALPGIALVQVIHVVGPASIEEARRIAPSVDAILLDSGKPDQTNKELGGTGRVHNWSVSAQIVASVPCPVYLAGGLRPENVADAIRTVRPFGVDACTGLRINGRLDPARLTTFFNALAGEAHTSPS